VLLEWCPSWYSQIHFTTATLLCCEYFSVRNVYKPVCANIDSVFTLKKLIIRLMRMSLRTLQGHVVEKFRLVSHQVSAFLFVLSLFVVLWNCLKTVQKIYFNFVSVWVYFFKRTVMNLTNTTFLIFLNYKYQSLLSRMAENILCPEENWFTYMQQLLYLQ